MSVSKRLTREYQVDLFLSLLISNKRWREPWKLGNETELWFFYSEFGIFETSVADADADADADAQPKLWRLFRTDKKDR